MSIPIFEVQNRNLNISPNNLRKADVVPCVIYARGLKPSIPVQISYRAILDMFKVVNKGDAIDLKLEDTIHSCILANYDYDHRTSTLTHIDFYRLPNN
ncbi:MAG: hypothetical protein AB9856_13840 [Cellulosilyticaceae bacterium]